MITGEKAQVGVDDTECFAVLFNGDIETKGIKVAKKGTPEIFHFEVGVHEVMIAEVKPEASRVRS